MLVYSETCGWSFHERSSRLATLGKRREHVSAPPKGESPHLGLFARRLVGSLFMASWVSCCRLLLFNLSLDFPLRVKLDR